MSVLQQDRPQLDQNLPPILTNKPYLLVDLSGCSQCRESLHDDVVIAGAMEIEDGEVCQVVAVIAEHGQRGRITVDELGMLIDGENGKGSIFEVGLEFSFSLLHRNLGGLAGGYIMQESLPENAAIRLALGNAPPLQPYLPSGRTLHAELTVPEAQLLRGLGDGRPQPVTVPFVDERKQRGGIPGEFVAGNTIKLFDCGAGKGVGHVPLWRESEGAVDAGSRMQWVERVRLRTPEIRGWGLRLSWD